MDHHIPSAITDGLLVRNVDCLTAQADGSDRLPDAELLQRASDLGRVLFSMDDDLLTIAAQWQTSGRMFAGVLYAHPLRITIGKAIEDLELAASILDPADMLNRVEHLPL
jgi:hypothetical protein